MSIDTTFSRHCREFFFLVTSAPTRSLFTRRRIGSDIRSRAFPTSRIDYCNALVAAARRRSQQISCTNKFDGGLSRMLHNEPVTSAKEDYVFVVVCLFMAALHSRMRTSIFILWFLLSSFFISSPNLSGRTLDVYHTSTHGVALVRI